MTSDRVIGNNDIITIDLSPQVGNIWGRLFENYYCEKWQGIRGDYSQGEALLVEVQDVNILNVACMRAKYRIAFIGNLNDWKNRRYFREFIPKFIDIIDA